MPLRAGRRSARLSLTPCGRASCSATGVALEKAPGCTSRLRTSNYGEHLPSTGTFYVGDLEASQTLSLTCPDTSGEDGDDTSFSSSPAPQH